MKWQPIKTAPLNTPIIVTDGARQYMAMQKTSWVFNETPLSPANGLVAQAITTFSVGKPFTPTLWMAIPPVPKVRA